MRALIAQTAIRARGERGDSRELLNPPVEDRDARPITQTAIQARGAGRCMRGR